MTKGTVLTPNERAADALRVPFMSLEQLATKRLSEAGHAVASVIDNHQAFLRAVITVTGSDDPRGEAPFWQGAVNEVLRAGTDLAALARAASPRARTVARLAQAFGQELDKQGLIPRPGAMTAAMVQGGKRHHVMVYGYPRLGVGELAFLDALADDGSALVLPYLDHPLFTENRQSANFLAERGWSIEYHPAPQAPGPAFTGGYLAGLPVPPSVCAGTYPTMEAEVRDTLAQIKGLIADGTPAAEIVLVARHDRQYGPLVLEIGQEYGLPIRAFFAVPLAETRMGIWLGLVMEAAGNGFAFETTARLLRHPFGRVLGSRLEPAVWDKARKLHPTGLPAWRKLDVDLSLLDWPERASRAQWLAIIRELIDRTELRRIAGQWARETLAFNVLLQDGLPILAAPGDGVISRHQVIEVMADILGLLTVPAEPGRGGIEFHTPLSLDGARQPHVFTLGLAEGVMPARIADDPALDFHERQQLVAQGFTIETAAEGARREALSLWSLLQVATTSHRLSSPALMGTTTLEPSPLLADIPPVDRPGIVASPEEARQIHLRRPGEWEDEILAQARQAYAIELRREGADPPDDYDGVIGQAVDHRQWAFSASQLLAFGQCAFKWMTGSLWRLSEPEEAEDGMSPLLKGNFYHRVLELALKPAIGQADTRAIALSHLEEAFAVAERELGTLLLPAWQNRRHEHLSALRRIIGSPSFITEGAQVLRCEDWFRGDWHGLRVQGRIDRLDRAPEGLVLIDYKTRSTRPAGAKDANGNAKVDIQLALYRGAAAPALFPDEPVADAYYFSLNKAAIIDRPTTSDDDVTAVIDRVKAAMTAGDFRVDPDNAETACQYCAFDPLCRRGPRLGRKERIG